MEHIVTGCKDCPFYTYYALREWTDSDCKNPAYHPPPHEQGLRPQIPVDYTTKDPITPHWCPLKKEPITVIMK